MDRDLLGRIVHQVRLEWAERWRTGRAVAGRPYEELTRPERAEAQQLGAEIAQSITDEKKSSADATQRHCRHAPGPESLVRTPPKGCPGVSWPCPLYVLSHDATHARLGCVRDWAGPCAVETDADFDRRWALATAELLREARAAVAERGASATRKRPG